jgi:hypothetical protein
MAAGLTRTASVLCGVREQAGADQIERWRERAVRGVSRGSGPCAGRGPRCAGATEAARWAALGGGAIQVEEGGGRCQRARARRAWVLCGPGGALRACTELQGPGVSETEGTGDAAERALVWEEGC